ncbi:MAG: rhodanese-like domain-containing protein [Pseudomonadota bacterium]|nr:rhodanese-like domain-containing protein [Pseudomonadota bacterium]
MKRTLIAALFAGLAFAGTSAQALTSISKETDVEMVAIKLANEAVKGGYKLITIEEVKKMLDAKEDFILVDAHPKWEYEMGYIDGARWFGFQSNTVDNWEKDVTDGPRSQAEYLAVLGSDKNKKIVIYCGFTKCGRSHNAAMWAKKLGYTNVYRAPGGITVWKDLGYSYKVVPNTNNVYPNK